jgi:catecholate siderophore receptor
MPLTLRTPVLAPAAVALLVAGAPCAAGVAAEADAANAASAAPDIVVTGIRTPGANPLADPQAPYKVDRSASSKLTEPVADTPKSIVIIPRQVIQDEGALSIRDLARTQSGVTLGTGEGGNAFGDRIFIRGFDARNDVYIDGLRDPGVTSREVFAVEQIEIVKGPSSTFGGRGTTGGAVSLISKAPQKSDFAEVDATGGSDATRRFTVDLNRTLGDTVQVRVNGLWHDADVAGRDTTYGRRWGVAAALAWQPASTVDLVADYYHLGSSGLPDWGVPFDVRTQQPFAVDRHNFYGVIARDFNRGTANIGTLRAEWRVAPAITLTSKTRFGATTSAYIATVPERPSITDPNPANWTVQANPQNRNAVATTWANATEAAADFTTFGLHHRLVAGVEFDSEKIVNRPFAFAASEDSSAVPVPTVTILQNLYHPSPFVAYTQVATLSGVRAETRIITKGVYALDTVDLTPTVKLSGGIRFDDYTVTSDTTSPTAAEVFLRNHSQFVNWNAGVVWKPVPKATLYVSASTSSNPSGEQSDASSVSYGGLGSTTANLDAERNRSYEAGVKYQAGAGGHVLLTAALFRTDKTNGRVIDPLSGVSQVLAGKQRVDGVELGASGNLTPRWAVFGGYTYLDARVLPSTDPTVAGGRFPNIPDQSFSLLSTYRLFGGVTAGGQATYNSARYGGSTVAGTATLPGYWRFDATLKASVSSKIELQLNALNLTDKVYYDAIYRSAAPFAYIAPGRSVLGTVRVKL